MKKLIPTREFVFNSLFSLYDDELRIVRNNALTDKFNGVYIDTCKAIDTGKWETGIEVYNKVMKIVEIYKNKKEAIAGHKKWVAKLKKNKNYKLTDKFSIKEEL